MPRELAIPEQDRRYESASSVTDYFQKTGKAKKHTLGQVYKARNLFVTKGCSEKQVANALGLSERQVAAWVVLFDWRTDQARVQFGQFKSLAALSKKRQESMNVRYERSAAGLQDLIERKIHDYHSEPSAVKASEVAQLAKALECLQGVERVSHGEARETHEHRYTVSLDSEEAVEAASRMVEDLVGNRPLLQAPRQELPDATDAEFEVIER